MKTVYFTIDLSQPGTKMIVDYNVPSNHTEFNFARKLLPAGELIVLADSPESTKSFIEEQLKELYATGVAKRTAQDPISLQE